MTTIELAGRPTPECDAALLTVMHQFTALQWVEGKAVHQSVARSLERRLAVAVGLLEKLPITRCLGDNTRCPGDNCPYCDIRAALPLLRGKP